MGLIKSQTSLNGTIWLFTDSSTSWEAIKPERDLRPFCKLTGFRDVPWERIKIFI